MGTSSLASILKRACRVLLVIGLMDFAVMAWSASARTDNQTYFGPGYGFGLTAPPQWVESRPGFAPVLFTPVGHDPDDSPTVIYVRPALKAPLKVRTVAEMHALDLRGMRARSPGIKSRKRESIQAGGAIAEVYEFTGGRYHEFVAYFNQETTMVLVVLSTEASPPDSATLSAWKTLAGSYRWLPELAGR